MRLERLKDRLRTICIKNFALAATDVRAMGQDSICSLLLGACNRIGDTALTPPLGISICHTLISAGRIDLAAFRAIFPTAFQRLRYRFTLCSLAYRGTHITGACCPGYRAPGPDPAPSRDRTALCRLASLAAVSGYRSTPLNPVLQPGTVPAGTAPRHEHRMQEAPERMKPFGTTVQRVSYQYSSTARGYGCPRSTAPKPVSAALAKSDCVNATRAAATTRLACPKENSQRQECF